MKKILLALVLFFFFNFIFADISLASSLKITSPQKGDIYTYGDFFEVIWSPKKRGVNKIQIVSKDTPDTLTIFSEKLLAYETNYQGYFEYQLPEYLILRPGRYRVKITLESGAEYFSGIFQIQHKDSDSTMVIKPAKYSLGDFINLKKNYKTRESINFFIKAYEESGVVATLENGFSVRANIFENSDSETKKMIDSVIAKYDYYDDVWSIKTRAPSNSGRYKLVTSVYCRDISIYSYCANTYGRMTQAKKEIDIDVKKQTKKYQE